MKPVAFQALLHVLVTLVVVAIVLLAYDYGVVRPGRVIGVVDLNAVYRQKEAEFTRRVTEATTEAERDQAMQAAREFAQRLPLALESLPRECRCLVMLSSAVVTPSPGVLDLTPRLRQKVEHP